MAKVYSLFLWEGGEKRYLGLQRVIGNRNRKLLWYENTETGKIGIHDLEKDGPLPENCRPLIVDRRRRVGTLIEEKWVSR